MAALLNGASPLGWAAKLLREPDIGKLIAEAEADGQKTPPLYFLPYLTGERTPHNDPHAKGAFIGITPETTRAQVIRAVMEGAAFALADCQEILGRTGPLPGEIGVVGGGSKSAFWMQIIADMLGRTGVAGGSRAKQARRWGRHGWRALAFPAKRLPRFAANRRLPAVSRPTPRPIPAMRRVCPYSAKLTGR